MVVVGWCETVPLKLLHFTNFVKQALYEHAVCDKAPTISEQEAGYVHLVTMH